ncbi:MAG: phytase [Bacteroidota bacterium]
MSNQKSIVEDKSIRNIQRPNNVDIEYGFKINDSITEDVLVFTEREKNQIRVFSVPDMRPLDNGGFKVFKDAKIPDYKSPMGVALYKSPNTNKLFAIIGRKGGPSPGYLHQYELVSENGIAKLTLVREFGKFSGKKEIEAIAVDDALGYVYYSDEGQCIRKYNAEPSKGNEELACFGQEFFWRI